MNRRAVTALCRRPTAWRRRGTGAARSSQRGNALIWTMLAIAAQAVLAMSLFENKRLELKIQAGQAEATVLESLRTAANNASIALMGPILEGVTVDEPSVRNPGSTVTIEARPEGGFLVWRPTVAQLADLGYLPSGWTATNSSLNNQPYKIAWRRQDPCAGAGCEITGTVMIEGPILADGIEGSIDGPVTGQILTHFGSDAGITLFGEPTKFAAFGGGHWDNLDNPLRDAPPGVIAVRFGANSSLMSQFVRIGDSRDPKLTGNLSAVGNLAIDGTATVRGGVTVTDAAGDPCVSLTPAGDVNLNCNGAMTAKRGTFADGADKTVISATQISSGGDVQAARNLTGQRLVLSEVMDGAPCSVSASTPGSEYASLAGAGGLAGCVGGKWVAMTRYRRASEPCAPTEEGASATDPANHQSLICRRGQYIRTAALLSNFVLMETVTLTMTAAGPQAIEKPVCADSGGLTPEPLIMLTAYNEDPLTTSTPNGADITLTLSGVNRYATSTSASHWEVHQQRSSDNSPLPGALIASTYCYYP